VACCPLRCCWPPRSRCRYRGLEPCTWQD